VNEIRAFCLPISLRCTKCCPIGASDIMPPLVYELALARSIIYSVTRPFACEVGFGFGFQAPPVASQDVVMGGNVE